ncbi:uncharacterized protein LOC144770439 [Lissotriton helveticus]
MDHILESEVLVVVLQAPEGLSFGEFRRLFHSTHGYPLDLARYGYSSLQRLLDDMKYLVAVVAVADQEPQIACRSIQRHTYVFLGENKICPKVGLRSVQSLKTSSTSNRPRDVPGLREVSRAPSSSLCLLASEDQTPASEALLTEKWATNLEKLKEDWNEQHPVDDLQQPNSQSLESAKPGMVVPCQEGIQRASELLANTLSTFATGLKLRKLKEAVKTKHGTDLEELSRSLGYVDVLHLLEHLPNIRLLHPSRPAKCVVQLQGGLGETSLSSSQCSLASGFQTPSSDVFLTENNDTHLEKDCSDHAILGDLQPPTIQGMESAEASLYIAHYQKGIQKASELLANTLSIFATGLKLRKLKEVVKTKHGTDLEALSRRLGCVDVLHLLKHLPNIKLLHPSKPANCVVQLQEGLRETSLSSSQCSLASGVQTPSSDVFLTEKKATHFEENCSDESGDLQLPNIQCVEGTEASHYVYHHQEGIQNASELLENTLRTFATGLKLRKLKEVLKTKHGTDLEELSRSLGYVDVLHLLQHLPNIRLLHPSKPAKCVVQLQGGLRETSLSSSQCSLASGVQTPSSDAFLTEKKATQFEEDCGDQAALEDLQSPNIQCVKSAEASHYFAHHQEDSKRADGCKKLNNEKRGTVPSRSQSASTKPKPQSMPLMPRPLPCDSSTIPGSILPQNNIHNHNKPKQPFTKHSTSTNQVQRKDKNNLARRNSFPTKSQASKESSIKYPFQVQKPYLNKKTADHDNVQHQEKSYTPQVSRLRTAALSYSSVVSHNISEATVNRPPLNNSPASYSTSIHYIDASNSQHSAQNFAPPISDFPPLSEKTQIGSQCSSPLETDDLLTSGKNSEELRNNILFLLEAHPEGMSLFQFQNTYRRMFHHMLPLNGYMSVKQMLEEMKEVLRMEDRGIQHWVFPVSSRAPSTERMDEELEDSESQPVGEPLSHYIDATMSTSNQLKHKPQNETEHNLFSSKAIMHNSARNLSKPTYPSDYENTCGPEHPVATATGWTEHTSNQLNQPLDNETLKNIPFPELLSNEFPPLQQAHTKMNTSDELSSNKCMRMQGASITHQNFKTHIAPFAYSSIVKGKNEVGLSSNSISANFTATTSFSNEQLITSLGAGSGNHSCPQLPVPTSNLHHLSMGSQDDQTYSETPGLSSDAPQQAPTCVEELKRNIFQVLTQYPDGMSIFQFQKMYRFMFNHILPLDGYSSVKQLLLTIPDVVKTRGLGVQMLVFPVSSDIPSCQVILEENGLSLSEMETMPSPTEQESGLRNTSLSAKAPISLNVSDSAVGKAVHATSPGPSASSHSEGYVLNPEAIIFSPSPTMCFPQFSSMDHNGVSTPFSKDISGDSCHTPSVTNFLA